MVYSLRPFTVFPYILSLKNPLRQKVQIGLENVVLLAVLFYLCADLCWQHWEKFEEGKACARHPVHKWLLTTTALGFLAQLVRVASGSLSPKAASQIADSSVRKPCMAWWLTALFIRAAALCLALAWATLGTKWWWTSFVSAPQCVPEGEHRLCLAFWQFIGYALPVRAALTWLGRPKPHGMQQTSTPRVLNDDSLNACSVCLLGTSLPDAFADECAICLQTLRGADTARRLVACDHTFHRVCIDRWLERHAECPLCRQNVRGVDGLNGTEVAPNQGRTVSSAPSQVT